MLVPTRILSLFVAALVLAPSGPQPVTSQPVASQPVLGHRSARLLTVDGLQFKDLNHNGRLDPFEDWRLSPEARTADLVARLSLEEMAGLMVHGTLPAAEDPLASIGRGRAYDLQKARDLIVTRHISSFITRLDADASTLAAQSNGIQEIAESSAFGIPVTLSSDPRHHFEEVIGASGGSRAFSAWPEPLGFAAINDPALTRRFGDIVRREYLAVGFRESLAPQADLVTEPRWARANGTFGEDAQLASRMVQAYVTGIQDGSSGLHPGSVIAVVKHWVGYGAVKDGWDSHNFYGRFASFEPGHFDYHIQPFLGAFEAHVAAVMPTYPILQGVEINGKPLEPVAAGFNKELLNGLLRGRYGFTGVVLSDWAITNDCSERCQHGAPAGSAPGVDDIGMPWGVGDLTKAQRFAKAINAGVDQVGGTEESQIIVDDVHRGLIPEARVKQAAGRILLQKFQTGLFEQPFVDESRASTIAGNPEFVREGQQAQARAVVLLKNASAPSTGKPLLPLRPGARVFLYGIDPAAARSAGLTPVADAPGADIAIIHAPAPYASEHLGFFFGSRQHEGRLNFTPEDKAYTELLRISRTTPTIFVTTLERPLILTEVQPHASALLGDFGIADTPLLALLTGKVAPQGHLPFELPRSPEAVRNQKSDLPHDSINPLYAFGFGLSY